MDDVLFADDPRLLNLLDEIGDEMRLRDGECILVVIVGGIERCRSRKRFVSGTGIALFDRVGSGHVCLGGFPLVVVVGPGICGRLRVRGQSKVECAHSDAKQTGHGSSLSDWFFDASSKAPRVSAQISGSCRSRESNEEWPVATAMTGR